MNDTPSSAPSHPACAICGGGLARVLLSIERPDRFERHAGTPSEQYRRQWVECARCGAASNVMRPADAARLARIASAYYAIDFPDTPMRQRFDQIMALPADRSDNAQRVVRVRDYARRHLAGRPAPYRLLDIGAGLGLFPARFLADTAPGEWQVVGIEPDPLASAHLRALGRFPVVAAPFPCPLPHPSYSLCTLNKVLEHFHDPVALLRDLAALLTAERGLIYVEVPDKLTIDFRPPEDNILGALHCHLYSPGSLATLFERAGFAALSIERCFEPSGKITVYGFAVPQAAIPALAGQAAAAS